jgi:hypothetical protein
MARDTRNREHRVQDFGALVHVSVREPEAGNVNIADWEVTVVFYACGVQLARYVLEQCF